MRFAPIILILTLLISACGPEKEQKSTFKPEKKDNHVEVPDFKELIESSGLKGSLLIFDGTNFYSNDFKWAHKGHLPASTYKIPNSLIALELGIMENDSTISEWDGEPRYMKRWERDMYFRDAFHQSCVPCYQEIAREVGVRRMKDFVYKFNYGQMDIDSSNIDMFWLEGKSRISQFEQIDFLRAFNEKRLLISDKTYETMRRMMIIEENENFVLRGKTGWSVTKDQDNCWFVGWVETNKGQYYFATNIEPGPTTNADDLFIMRKEITYRALELITIE
ncbi:MAG: class D beta-lactamase [Fluviicola sp. XM-24bin1]|nr:MAG: class D beta-lactamase [Fluviicola sp. XM-24bin1]